ncbi:MAG: hypothetical protein KAX57_01285 [Rhodoferax sp.]|jgi:hypothetical protein|uniref:hypothetical protein n=1 Tax=Rhodoferax sp. TaxID=50421 RepID=UPI001B607E87|nr:hypothetical protein [Rhodoferax sp.]MBP8285451.1 hypothetical protein [Rhodoferax sp.]MBP9734291.1 hypothetical protein [Rhodoferax sp.]
MTTVTASADTVIAESEATDIPEATVDPMRVLKVATTTSLSNKSILGYAIGCDESNAIYLSLRSNTAAGMFSTNWVAFMDIANALVHADKITSATLAPLYAGTSRNNAGFMLAVLRGEGLVCPSERHYMRQDFKPFLQHINSLIAAGVDLGDADEALAALETVADVAEVDAAEAVEVPVAKRGRPSKRT